MAAKAMLAMDRGLLRAGERVCVAVSGGADSVALLLGLVEANADGVRGGRSKSSNCEPLGVVLSAAHVHHGLRGAEADGDEAFVRELCERVGVPLKVFRVDTATRRAAEGEGLEEAARELRYEALRGLMTSGVVDVVATAHTLDDQAETVLCRYAAIVRAMGASSFEVLATSAVRDATNGVEFVRRMHALEPDMHINILSGEQEAVLAAERGGRERGREHQQVLRPLPGPGGPDGRAQPAGRRERGRDRAGGGCLRPRVLIGQGIVDGQRA